MEIARGEFEGVFQRRNGEEMCYNLPWTSLLTSGDAGYH